jgi:signal transduction histidine kinase/uncharacterized membrane protein
LGSWQTVSWALVLCAPLMIALTAISFVDHPAAAGAPQWAAFAYLCVISMYVGYSAWYRGLAIGPMAQVSQVQLTQPALSIAWSAAFLGETVGWATIAGGTIVVVSAAAAVRARVAIPTPRAARSAQRHPTVVGAASDDAEILRIGGGPGATDLITRGQDGVPAGSAPQRERAPETAPARGDDDGLGAAGLMSAKQQELLEQLGANPDLILRMDAAGTYLEVRANERAESPLQPHELVGRNVRDLAPPRVAEAMLACARRARESGEMHSIDCELELDGAVRYCESRMLPSGDGEVVIIMRDFTTRRRADAELRRLAEEQAALRRVATVVASDAAPEQVFQLVTEEVCRLLGIREAVLERFVDSETGTVVGRFGSHMVGAFEIGCTLPIEEGLIAWKVLHTGAPASVDSFQGATGELAARIRVLGYRSAVGVPIVVAASTWGALVAALREGESLSPEMQRRMQAFAELVALAVATADSRDELAASRLRIVEASDSERRRIERNLHDGAQQRLVALSLGLRLVQKTLRASPGEAERLLEESSNELAEALTELRELAQGIHPAVLTERGLAAALEVLASRAPLAVALEVHVPQRLPEPVETATYYTISEALANVVKHADADSARVRVERFEGRVAFEIADNGVGGADPDRGSGLRGLRDRVETLDGALWIESASGRGTLVRAEIPVSSRNPATVGRYS